MSRLLLLLVAFCLSFGIIIAQNDAVCVSGELDLVFIIDASNSIGWGNFLRLKNFLRGFLTHLSIDNGAVRVGAVVYSTSVEIEFHLDSYTTSADIDKHMSKIKYTDGVTFTAGALNVTKNVLFTAAKGDREDIPNFVILVTDGNSNYRKDLTIEYADNLKDVAVIYALGIGKELEENSQELMAIVRQPDLGNADMYQMLKDYQALEELKVAIFDNMCPSSPCYEEGKVFEKRCRTFKCINSKWKKMGFTGCINNGKCFEWGEKRSDICYQYKCSKPAGCSNNLCPSFNYRLINAGCMVDGQCVDENKIVEDTNVCANYQCIRRTFDNNEVYSEYLMVGKECVRSDGTCSEVGYTYKEHCISYECQASTFNGILTAEFIPVNTACKYGNKCVQLGERVTEVCDILICNYDDQAMGYELMLESQGCEHNGQCLMKNQKVFEESTCTNFVCSYSKRQNRLVMKERVAGCKGTDGSCAAKGEVVTQKGCIKYQCDNKGNLELIEAGCDVGGECKPVGSKWRQPGECAVFRCVLVDTMDDSVETDIEQDLECHNFDGECVKPGEEFDDHCMTYRCKNNGKLDRVAAKCEYDGKCYDIGDDWVDRKRCKHVVCRADKKLGAVFFRRKYGCKDDKGNCFAPGEFAVKDGSCVKYKCYSDHILRREDCEFKGKCYGSDETWVDMAECLKLSCYKDDFTGESELSSSPYGCLEEGICKNPGDTYEKDCQKYECQPNGQGFQIIDSKCPWKNNCKNLNQTWFDKKTCRRYGCFEDEDGLDIEEITYGCRGMNDECINDRKDLDQDNCISYDCNNGKLVPQKVGCELDGECMKVNDYRVDSEKCIKYRCVMSSAGDGFIATKIKEIRGCLDHDQCFFPGAKKVEDCSTYVCSRDGTFKIQDPQCEFLGQCIPLGTKWRNDEKCKKFRCELSKLTGRPVVKSFVWGCMGRKKCVKFGGKRRLRRCVVHQCQKTDAGPSFVPVKIGCLKDNACRPLDSSWVNQDLCVRETCGYEEGNMFPDILPSPYGCTDESGVCRPFGAKVKDENNPCIKYKCTRYGTMVPVIVGCPYNDKCKADGAVWRNTKTCTTYKCKRENVSPTRVIMHTVEKPGCKGIDGKCVKQGDTRRYECTDYVCDTSRGGLVITGQGCMHWKECKPLNSTWMEPRTCITYQCRYDQVLNDLFITEKQYGCQDESGECFSKGQRKQRSCNKFVCNAKGNFQVVKAGCEKNGKCYAIDESWQEGCVWYTCAMLDKGPNFVETEIAERHGCVGVDGKCYEPGETFRDGCISYKCKPGGDFEEENFGCVGFDGGCVLPGETIDNDCNKYQCDPSSLALQPVHMSCSVNGVCKEIDDKWFDKETCLGYRCVYNPETNDVDVIERISGCQTADKCVRPGARVKGKDCVKFQCKQGKMVPTDIGCEYDGECLPLHMSIQEGCSWKKCVIAAEGPNFIDTRLITEHGCWDCYHKCHRVGDEFTHGCKTTQCMAGGFSKTISNRCMTPDGYCIGFNEVYEYTKGTEQMTYVCGEVGDLEPVVVDHKCKMSAFGKEYDVGAEVVMECKTYKCVKTIDAATFVQIGEKCRGDDGTCYPVDQSAWDAECAQYSCSRSKGVLQLSSQQGCKDAAGQCHSVGSVWDENTESQCVTKSCNVEGLTYFEKIITHECRDIQGKCRQVGDSGFDVKMNGLIYQSCICNYENEKVVYQCQSTSELP
ncbi:unnamed protein product [Mytilus edulis]|uniref:VWFA domain-containing protein n=1 Tax=Mytilus edulis TaxID=6550 RepID=A0A8S3TUI7_MYTED|nr:unnamed protein product [Mytilus edulis]